MVRIQRGQTSGAGSTKRTAAAVAGIAVALLASGFVAAPPAGATGDYSVTAIASAPSDFTNANGIASDAHLSEDGRFVTFTSTSTNLVPDTSTPLERVYLHDLWTDEVTLVSHNASGTPNGKAARASAITKDGSHVVFASTAALDPADTNLFNDVYIWTRATDEVELVSTGFNGAETDGNSGIVTSDPAAAVSDDGRYVAFVSAATNLTAGNDTNAKNDIFRKDRTSGTTTWVSLNGASQLNGQTFSPDMSANGRFVVFGTVATNLPGTDTNGSGDIWLRDLNDLTIVKISVGLDADANGSSLNPAVSDNGNLVTFDSTSTDLVASDTNAQRDVFVRNRSGATTTRVSVYNSTGAQLPLGGVDPAISANGSKIAFTTVSPATAIDTNGVRDVYVRDGSSTLLESLDTAHNLSEQNSDLPSVNDDGDVAWQSTEAFATTDTNGKSDVFVAQDLFLGPFTTVEDFVDVQLERFRGTPPSMQAIADEAKLIRAGASPLHFIMQLTDEAAFSAKRAPLARLYWAYFKRRPDLGGFNFWLNKYRNGKRLVDISQEFAKSSEFKNTYGNTTSTQFVTLVYQNVLERQPEAAGLTYWANKIDNGTPRGQVMTNFSESSEGQRVIGPRSDTILVALGMYAKIPSQALFDAAVADRQNGWPREIIPAYILGAPEYQTTVV